MLIMQLKCELVMTEGMTIRFRNAHGEMTVTALPGYERAYTWAGATRNVTMLPRSKRWYGSLGIYNGGGFIPGRHEPWEPHDGVARFLTAVEQARPILRATTLEITARTSRVDREVDRLTARILIGAIIREAQAE